MSMELSNQEPAFANERQDRIAELVASHGKVRTGSLTSLLGVSEPTIRKDLASLEQRGVLRRTHGGAVAVRPPLERDPARRGVEHAQEKQAIARACLELISEGDAIFLDGGTTVRELARALSTVRFPITVLTNAPAVADAVADHPMITHILTGGQLRPLSGALIGPLVLDNLERFTINVAFIGASGLSEGGITVSDLGEAQVKAAVIERAQRVVVPVDHTKIGVADFVRVCGLDEIDVVVTDEKRDRLEKFCSAAGVESLVASP